MLDRSQITRLITIGLATCAVTWLLAAGALAGPYIPADTGSANTAPAYKVVPGDTGKTPDPAQVQKVLAGIGNHGALPHSTANGSGDVAPLTIVLSIAGVMALLGAGAVLGTRRRGRMLGA